MITYYDYYFTVNNVNQLLIIFTRLKLDLSIIYINSRAKPKTEIATMKNN